MCQKPCLNGALLVQSGGMATLLTLAPSPWVSLGRLRDRSCVVLRPILPADAAALREAFAGLSPETRYQRFHGTLMDLTPDFLRYLTAVDGVDHVAWVAVQRGAIVGVARFVRQPASEVAEVAFVVTDRLQGQGIGALLRDRLVEEARARGIRRFVAEVLPDNSCVRRLLRAPCFEPLGDSGRQIELGLRPVGWRVPDQRSSA
jgi:GNAT superfamily N-acetyltransferase